MNKASPVVLSICLMIFIFNVKTYPNPLPDPPYSLDFIAEVQIKDSKNWSIELDRSCIDYNIVNANKFSFVAGVPCTTSAFKLRFMSKPDYYSTKLIFDSSGIAVLTRNSITGIPKDQIVSINANKDTIKIVDTAAHDEKSGWRMPINTYCPTKSFMNTGLGNSILNINPNIGIKNSVFFDNAGPASYEYCFIDEVFITDSLNWAFEINGYDYTQRWYFPFTSTNLKIRFSSNKAIFPVKIEFDSSGIGVLSPNSITGTSQGIKVPIKIGHDSLIIIDTIIKGCERAYRLSIDSIVPGKSLIFKECSGSFSMSHSRLSGTEWTSPSIGRQNGRICKISLVDTLNNPYKSDVCAFKVHDTTLAISIYKNIIYGKTVNNNSVIYLILDPCSTDNLIFFSEPIITETIRDVFKNDSIWLGRCIISNPENADTIYKTIVLKPHALYTTSAILHKSPVSVGSGFKVIESSNHKMVFIVTLRENVKDLFLRMYSINGKMISSLKINNNYQKGTFTIPGETLYGKNVVKGTYLFSLVANGEKTASRAVMLP